MLADGTSLEIVFNGSALGATADFLRRTLRKVYSKIIEVLLGLLHAFYCEADMIEALFQAPIMTVVTRAYQ